MKESNYNYIVKHGNNSYCFNAITKLFFSISKEKEDIMRKILKYPDQYKTILPLFYQKLIHGNFIIDDNINEIDTIRKLNYEACNSKVYRLIILPTIDCNFRCWYCYEKHTAYIMSEETVTKVQKYITKILNNEEIDSLNIEWFGGEPFLAFEKVIKPITRFAKEICEKKNIPFFTGATSNGYLINPSIANELSLLNFKSFQITLDGEKSKHDKTRIAPDNSSFDVILKNMDYVCDVNKEINIILRINYDNENFQPELIIEQIKALIKNENRHRFSFLIRKVWQIKEVEKGKEKILEFIKLAKDANFNFHHENDFVMDFVPCYAAKKNTKLITPYGSVGKCTTRDDFEKQALGILTDNGDISWNSNLPFDEIYSKPLFENERCLKCKQLPLCMGVCPKNINTNGEIEETEECKGKVNDLNLTDVIANYCETLNQI